MVQPWTAGSSSDRLKGRKQLVQLQQRDAQNSIIEICYFKAQMLGICFVAGGRCYFCLCVVGGRGGVGGKPRRPLSILEFNPGLETIKWCLKVRNLFGTLCTKHI